MNLSKIDGAVRTGGPNPAFDPKSGTALERLIFNNRVSLVIFCALITIALLFQALHLEVNSSFEGMLPQSQPFIKNYLLNKNALRGRTNAVRIVVENTRGSIYEPDYLKVVQKINDTLYLEDGVDRSFVQSLWSPAVRWLLVTEEGFKGGPVMADDYDGSPQSLATLQDNVRHSGIVGSLVSNDQRSSVVFVPLLDRYPDTGKPLDYGAFSRMLEKKIRDIYQSDGIKIHIIGFAKLEGDLIGGLTQVMLYFGIAATIATAALFAYTRCIRSTLLVPLCSMAAVIWQLGLVHLLGYSLDPYSMLVPFLVFSIGVSHGAQKMNGIMQDVGRGAHKYVAARFTFRRLFVAGLSALVADAVGFGVLVVIDIPVIRSLAIAASLGVTVLVFTNLVLLPILLSFTGVSPDAAARTLRAQAGRGGTERIWTFLGRFTERRRATGVVLLSVALAVVASIVGLRLQTGDLDPGAPELRADSQYNRDNAFTNQHFGLSSDVFSVIVKSPSSGMGTFPTLIEEDRLEQLLRQLPVVQTTDSAANKIRFITAGSYEGSPKWLAINRSSPVIASGLNEVGLDHPELIDSDWSVGTVQAYLTDHKATTLDQIVAVTEAFGKQHDTADRQFLLAAGNAGIEAATNIAVRAASVEMLALVYAAVMVLCYVTFRSWRAVLVAVIPLALTSILCQALMVMLGIGVKVATLPVTALGVGIGVDYALYLVSIQLACQRQGQPLQEAYRVAIGFTGKVVALVGVTLAAGVVTWAFSPIKFQADMGVLLTFMFLWNMVGALVLTPALSYFLLPTKSLVPAADRKRDARSYAATVAQNPPL